MEVEKYLTRAQLRRLYRNTAIRKEYNKLIDSGLKTMEAMGRIADKYELSVMMVRLIIRRKTAL